MLPVCRYEIAVMNLIDTFVPHPNLGPNWGLDHVVKDLREAARLAAIQIELVGAATV